MILQHLTSTSFISHHTPKSDKFQIRCLQQPKSVFSPKSPCFIVVTTMCIFANVKWQKLVLEINLSIGCRKVSFVFGVKSRNLWNASESNMTVQNYKSSPPPFRGNVQPPPPMYPVIFVVDTGFFAHLSCRWTRFSRRDKGHIWFVGFWMLFCWAIVVTCQDAVLSFLTQRREMVYKS